IEIDRAEYSSGRVRQDVEGNTVLGYEHRKRAGKNNEVARTLKDLRNAILESAVTGGPICFVGGSPAPAQVGNKHVAAARCQTPISQCVGGHESGRGIGAIKT